MISRAFTDIHNSVRPTPLLACFTIAVFFDPATQLHNKREQSRHHQHYHMATASKKIILANDTKVAGHGSKMSSATEYHVTEDQAIEAALKEARTNKVRSEVLNLGELITAIMLELEPKDIIAARKVAKVWNEQYASCKAVRVAATLSAPGWNGVRIWGRVGHDGVRIGWAGWCSDEPAPRAITSHSFFTDGDVVIPPEASISDSTAPVSVTKFAWGSLSWIQRRLSPDEFATYLPCQKARIQLIYHRDDQRDEMLRRGFPKAVVQQIFDSINEEEMVAVDDGVRLKDVLASMKRLSERMITRAVDSCERRA